MRVRSATLQHHEKYADGRSFGLKTYSNILSLPSVCHLTQTMKIDLARQALNVEKELLQLNPAENKIMHPVIISRITNNEFAQLRQTSLDEILDTDLSDAKAKETIFKARISVLSVRPQLGASFKPDQIASFIRI